MANDTTADEALKAVFDGDYIVPEAPTDRDHIDKDSLMPLTSEDLALLPTGSYVEPWAQRSDESDDAWKKFLWFRDQGTSRTLTDTAEHFQVSSRSVQDLSSKHNWADRVRSWDSHLDRVYRLKLQEQVRLMADRHADQVVEALQVLALPFQAIAQRASDEEFLDQLGEMDIRRLFDITLKAGRVLPTLMSAERLSRGMPTEITQVEGEVIHDHQFSPSPDQAGAILAILERNRVLPSRTGEGGADEIAEAEVVEMDDDHTDAETDSVPPSAAS